VIELFKLYGNFPGELMLQKYERTS